MVRKCAETDDKVPTKPPVAMELRLQLRKAGRMAFVAHGEIGDGECPYDKGDNRRTAWFEGFFDARTRHRLSEKGIKLPEDDEDVAEAKA